MKFLCDNCKAKYQIADEKVAGKTVRMKCRKCGHQIEVRAAITETSVSAAPPTDSHPPAAPRGLATSLGSSSNRPKAPTPSQAPEGALAGAFQRNVSDRPGALAGPEASAGLSVTDEWYVAINGVPVGPVRLSELRRKAAAGSVTEDSLAWQEGLEEWRPVRTLPELAAIVREAALGNRPSLIAPPPPSVSRPPPPPRARVSQAPPAPAPRRPEAPPATQRLEEARPIAPGRSNVVPLHGARSDGDVAPVTSPLAPPTGRGGAAFAPATGVSIAPRPPTPSQAPRAPTPAPFAATAAPLGAPLTASDPFAVPAADPFAVKPPMAAPLTSSVSFAPPAPNMAGPASVVAPPPAKKGPPLWFWPVLAFTGVFGAFAAYRLIDKPQAERVIVEVPTPVAPTQTAAPLETAAPTPEASASAAPVAKPTTGPKVATGPAPATAATSKTADLSGLLGGGAGGPSVGGGASGPSASGGGLDSATVQRIVRDRSPGVKRACWERGGGDQKSSAKVNVAITVAPNGRVTSAQASGDDPVVSKCIENQVRNWSFPAPGSETTINVPFVFVRQ